MFRIPFIDYYSLFIYFYINYLIKDEFRKKLVKKWNVCTIIWNNI